MTIEALGITILLMLAVPILSKGKKFVMIERRHELRRSMKKMQGKYNR